MGISFEPVRETNLFGYSAKSNFAGVPKWGVPKIMGKSRRLHNVSVHTGEALMANKSLCHPPRDLGDLERMCQAVMENSTF